ncbi:MAG: acetate/propionate family kinase [Alphaproteobacteria bacterium]|nr:acetate/propionate family kinase [Alphaproteobacteria bacterium]
MVDTVLILNAGSSSVKFQLFACTEGLPRLATGSVTNIGTGPVLKAEQDGTDSKIKVNLPPDETQKRAVRRILDWVESLNANWNIVGVAHRFVHGGPDFFKPTLLTSHVFHRLKELIPLALLHQPHHLAAVGVITRTLPLVPQVACFDTAFHAHHEEKFMNYAVPQELTDKGVRRYGFHGLSYGWINQVLKKEYPDLAKGRVVVAHLGNGSSLCAIKNGLGIDTTMGMTVLDGLPMGTRTGSIDPGVVFYIIRELGMAPDEVEEIFYKKSGLKGLSGISNDVKKLLESDSPRAKYALDYFATYIAKNVASMAVSMGGIDGLVFTGGIGENAEPIRKAVLDYLAFMNIPRVLVIPTNEERYMAEQALDCLIATGKYGYGARKVG